MVLFTFCVLVHAAFYVLACNCWEPFLRETFIPKEQEQATSVFLHEPRETVQMSVMHLSNWWLRNYSQYWWPATFAKSGWSLLIQQLLWHFSFLCCCICNSLSLTHIHAFILCTSLFTFICLCVIEQVVEDLKESPLLSCFCSAFPSLQIRPRSLWFQTNNSWPDLLTTWLFLRTDKHSILSHPLPHHLSDSEFYGRKISGVQDPSHTLICPAQWWSCHLSFLLFCFLNSSTTVI